MRFLSALLSRSAIRSQGPNHSANWWRRLMPPLSPRIKIIGGQWSSGDDKLLKRKTSHCSQENTESPVANPQLIQNRSSIYLYASLQITWWSISSTDYSAGFLLKKTGRKHLFLSTSKNAKKYRKYSFHKGCSICQCTMQRIPKMEIRCKISASCGYILSLFMWV